MGAIDAQRRVSFAHQRAIRASIPRRGCYTAATLEPRGRLARISKNMPSDSKQSPEPGDPISESAEPGSPEPGSPEPSSPEPSSPEPNSSEPNSPEPSSPKPTAASELAASEPGSALRPNTEAAGQATDPSARLAKLTQWVSRTPGAQVLLLCLGLLASWRALLCDAPFSFLGVVTGSLVLFQLWVGHLQPLWAQCPERHRVRLGAVVCGLAALLYYHPLLFGDVPLQSDHPVFVLRARMMGDTLWNQHSLNGFSRMLFGGLPAHQMYPIGFDLLVCGMRGLFLGHISWESAYCLALLITIVAYPVTIYSLSVRYAGVGGALVAGLLALFEKGGWLQSGFLFNVDVGVASMSASGTLVLWCIWTLDRLIDRAGARIMALLALLVGAAILCHPMAIPLLGVTLPFLVIARAISGTLTPLARWVPLATAAGILGVMLAGVWLFPFQAGQAWYLPLATPSRPFQEVLTGIWHGNAMSFMAAPLLFGGLFGLAMKAARRDAHALFWLALVVFTWYIGSTTGLLDFRLLELLPNIGQIQMDRFGYVSRPGFLIGVGLAVRELRMAFATQHSPESACGKRWSLGSLAALAAPLLVYSLVQGRAPLDEFIVAPPAQTHSYGSQDPRYKQIGQLEQFLLSQPAGEVGRVALADRFDLHWMFLMSARTGIPVLKVGFVPENNYIHKFTSWNADLWQALGVTHLATRVNVPGELLPKLKEVARFNDLVVYQFLMPKIPPARMIGPGSVTVERFDDAAVDLHVEGASPESRVLLAVGNHSQWQATADGRELSISGASIGGSPPAFMEVPATNGSIRFRFAPRARERWAAFGSSVALLIIGLGLSGRLARSRIWPGVVERLDSWVAALNPLRGFYHWPVWVRGLLMVGAPLLIIGVWSFRPGDHRGQVVLSRISTRSADTQVDEVYGNQTKPCKAVAAQRGFACPSGNAFDTNEVVITLGDVLRPCITLAPLKDGSHRLTQNGVLLGEWVEGKISQSSSSPTPAEFVVALDGEVLGKVSVDAGWNSFRFPTPGRRGHHGSLSFSTQSPNPSGQDVCFSAATVW